MLTAFLLVTGLTLVFVGSVAVKVAQQRVHEHGLLMLAWRYLSGQPHHGRPLTDAGWSRRGTRALTPTGHVGQFWHLPQKTRVRRRLARVGFAVLAVFAYLFRAGALLTLALAVAAYAAYWTWRGVRWYRQLKHHRTWLYPAHLTAAPLAGHPLTMAPADWLTIEPDRSRVVAELPAGYNDDAKGRQRLADTLAGTLGIESPEVRYALAGPRPRLELAASQPPPAKVTLADAMAAIEAAKPDELVWGLGKKSQVVESSLSGDSPHIGLSMGSGAGKSVTARSLLAQQLHKGAIGIVLDPKMISHHWARELPNVVIYRKPAEIHGAVLWVDRELSRRVDVVLAGADDDGRVHATVGPRIFVVFEEMNAAVSLLRAYWREVREKSDPSRSPALDALDRVSFMGRQVLCNILYIGQRLSDKATGGGGDARENIGVIALSRYRPSTWKMLAPDFAMPAKDLTPGRLHVVSDKVETAQGIFMTTAEAKELALSGIVSPLPFGMPGAPRATGEPVSARELDSGPDLPFATVSGAPGPLPVSGVTLAEAHGAGVFGRLTLAGLRTARHRDESFPEPVGRRGLAWEYDVEALAGWARERN